MKKLLFVLTMLITLTLVACVNDTPVSKAPVIKVDPEVVEIYAGEEVDLLFGVSATDEVDKEVKVTVVDDGGFDSTVVGTYEITYKAVNSSNLEATAKRTIRVLAPLSQLTLEVRTNKLGEQKWQGTTINFKHDLYVELSEDTNLTKQSGVFHNNTDHDITLSVEGGYGVSAVIDHNGKVIEGRDGANSKLVNEKNPTRSGSTVTKFDDETTVASAFAQNLVIPSLGYAIVIQPNYAGTTADTDGRSFMNYNVIYEYGNCVKLFWADSKEVITPYVNQAPTVSGNTTVYVAINSTNVDINALVLAGLDITDDNGTFELADDVKITDVEILDNGGFDASKEGEYIFKLKTTDGKLDTYFTRVVSVLGKEKCVTVTIGDQSHIVLAENVAIDKDLTSVGNCAYIIYTPNYKLKEGEILPANGHGVALLLDEYGQIVCIYDGANGRKFTKEHHTLKPEVDTETCNPTTYLKDAYDEAKAGGYTLVVAPHTTINSAEGGSRKFLLNNRNYGEKVTITGLDFKTSSLTFSINGKTFTAEEGTYTINKILAANLVASQKMIVYTKDLNEETIVCNGFGVAIVLDKYGKLIRIYDGANAKLFDLENPNGKNNAGFTGNDYAVVAYKSLTEEETLIIFPNDGKNQEGSPRAFGLGLRTNGSLGKVATLTGFEFLENSLEFSINGKSFKAEDGTYTINKLLTSDLVAKQKMIVYTKDLNEETIVCNGFGVAIVLDKYGKLIRIYDGANAKLFDLENPNGKNNAGFTGNDYAVVAYKSLTEEETLIIFPNDGKNQEGSPRAFGLGLRTNGSLGKVATLTGFKFAEEAELTIGSKSFTKDGEVKVALNSSDATYNSHDFVIYTTAFRGTLGVVNGYGIAFVIKDNKVVRIYDGANVKYYDSDNLDGVKDETKCSATNYLKQAIASLGANEWVLAAPHDGGSNLARNFLGSNKAINASVKCTYVNVEPSTNEDMKAINLDGNYFFGASVAVNTVVTKAADYDFVVYSYGYLGRIIKNGWSEGFVIDATTGKIVKIYDGVNGKYFDSENNGVASGSFYNNATLASDAYGKLEPNQILVLALNGGKDSSLARKFFVGNRKLDKVLSFVNFEVKVLSEEKVDMAAIKVDGHAYFITKDQLLVNEETKVAPFLVYEYGYTGNIVKNGYGVAMVIDKTTGKVVRIYDGASGKYFDSENNGVGNIVKAAEYLEQAVKSLTENEYVLCAPNGGTTGNVARGLLYDNRKIGIVVELPKFDN